MVVEFREEGELLPDPKLFICWVVKWTTEENVFTASLFLTQFLHHVPPLQPIRHTPRPWIRFIYFIFTILVSRPAPPPSLLALAVRHLSPHSACFLALFPIVLNLPKLFKTLCLLLVPKTSSKLHENCKLGKKESHLWFFFPERLKPSFIAFLYWTVDGDFCKWARHLA